MLNYELIGYLVIGVIILAITFFIIKSFVKAIIITAIIIVLFKIGWGYTSDDLKNKFHLDRFVNPTIIEKYDDYTKKRKVDEVIDTDNINKTIDEGLDNFENFIHNDLEDKVNDFLKKTNEGDNSKLP